MKEYKFPNGRLYHIDAYRLENSDEDLGFEDIFYENNICVVEWGEFIEEYLPSERLVFNIRIKNDVREVEIISSGIYSKIEERIKEKVVSLVVEASNGFLFDSMYRKQNIFSGNKTLDVKIIYQQ